jgi:hypothetical protein
MIPNEVFYFATQGNKGIPSITCSSHRGTVPPCEVFHYLFGSLENSLYFCIV